jgi:asparaginyl-tRNA synthetase
MGWVRTKRDSKAVSFLAINDGSIIHNIQAVIDINNFDADLLKNHFNRRMCSYNRLLLYNHKAKASHQKFRQKKLRYLERLMIVSLYRKKGHTLEFFKRSSALTPKNKYFRSHTSHSPSPCLWNS